MSGVGGKIWTISVALYLIANGVLGVSKGGDFAIIFRQFLKGDINLLIQIAGAVSLAAGIALILELFNVELPFLETLILIIAIIWAVYILINLIAWVQTGFDNFWYKLQQLAVHLMVFASLLIATKKFD